MLHVIAFQSDLLGIVPPVEDGFHIVGRQQSEAQHPGEVGRVEQGRLLS